MTSFTINKNVTLYAERGPDRLPMCEFDVKAEVSRRDTNDAWLVDRVFIETTTRANVCYVPVDIKSGLELLCGDPLETLIYGAICNEIESDQSWIDEEYAASDEPMPGEYEYEEPDYV